MHVLVTGAGGYIGSALTDHLSERHELRLSDLQSVDSSHEFIQADVRDPDEVDEAVAGVDAIVHTPAWHGIHTDERTDREFWELNVEGTFNVLDAAIEHDVDHLVWLSSQAWYGGVEGKYSFTKFTGEATCEYFTNAHEDFSAIAIRPAAIDDPNGDGPTHVTNRKTFGEHLIRNIVSLRDVIGVTTAALETTSIDWGAYPALRNDPFTLDELEAWKDDPIDVIEGHVSGAGELVERYDLDLPEEINRCGGHGDATMAPSRDDLGYEGQDTFVSFLEELADHDEQGTAQAWLTNELADDH